MDGNATGSAGVVADDRRRAADHSIGNRIDRARDHISAAQASLRYSSRQEVQHAQHLLEAAQGFLRDATFEAHIGAAAKGLRSSEAPDGAAARDAQVSPASLDADNDPIY